MVFAIAVGGWRLAVSPVFAAFEDIGTGARPTAFGETYVAAGQDVQSLMANPAGLSAMRNGGMSTEYSKLFAGLSDGSDISQFFFAYGQPIAWGGTLAMGVKQLSLQSLYKERTISMGYGRRLSDQLSVGLSVKQLYHAYGVPGMSVDDYGTIQGGSNSLFSEDGHSKTSVSFDLGAQYRLSEESLLGFSAKDLNQPNMALSDGVSDPVYRRISLAYAYRFPGRLILSTALGLQPSGGSQAFRWTSGFEKNWKTSSASRFAFRGSYVFGAEEERLFVTGLGFELQRFQIDYAFGFNTSGIGVSQSGGSHRFSLSYRFGQIEGMEVAPKQPVTIEYRTGNVPSSGVVDKRTGVNADGTDAYKQAPSDILIRSRLELLTALHGLLTQFVVDDYGQPLDDASSVEVVEKLFPALMNYYQACSENREIPEILDRQSVMDDCKRHYDQLRAQGAPKEARLQDLLNTLDQHLQPILMERPWENTDGRDLRYKQWMQKAWKAEADMVRIGTASKGRIGFYQRLLLKAIAFEKQMPEPLLTKQLSVAFFAKGEEGGAGSAVTLVQSARVQKPVKSPQELVKQLYDVLSYARTLTTDIDRKRALEKHFPVLQSFYQEADGSTRTRLGVYRKLNGVVTNYPRDASSVRGLRKQIDYLITSLTTFVEPAMRNRVWNPDDENQLAYREWLRTMWTHERTISRSNLEERLAWIEGILLKAQTYEERMQASQ